MSRFCYMVVKLHDFARTLVQIMVALYDCRGYFWGGRQMQIAAALPPAAARKPLLRQRCRQLTVRVFAWGIPGLSCLCFLTPSFGQPVDVLPLPITSPTAVQPATIDPLSPSGKAALALKQSFGIK